MKILATLAGAPACRNDECQQGDAECPAPAECHLVDDEPDDWQAVSLFDSAEFWAFLTLMWIASASAVWLMVDAAN